MSRKIPLTSFPELLKEWDYEKNITIDPTKIQSQSARYAWWKCVKCGYEWQAKIYNRANGRGCPCCARKVVVPGINNLATTHPELAKEWDFERNGDLTPDKVLYGTSKKIYWLCPEGHSYCATINHRSGDNGTACPICNSGRQTSFAEQAFFYYIKQVFPDAINRYRSIFANGMELDIFIPSLKLGIEYDGEAWHKKERIERELRKYKICQQHGIRLLRIMEKEPEGIVCTADETLSMPVHIYEHKYLAQAIRFLLDRIDPASNPWTRRDPRHIHSSVDINIARDEIEIRSYMTKLRKGSLAELYPEIAAEWHPTDNGNLTPDKVKPGSNTVVTWICKKCGNEYRTKIGRRTGKHPTGCPKCGLEKVTAAKRRAVRMLDLATGEVLRTFISASEASREMHISSGNITSVCNGRGRSQAGGYGWEFIE